MTPEGWQRVERLFLRVAELDPPNRAAALEEACVGNAALRREVEILLAGEDCVDSRFDEPVFGPRESEPTLVGQRLGPYRVREEIGRGGLGTVYRALREGDFDQEVALKVIKRGMDTDEVVRRFHAERRILARLVHPRIAHLLDGGSTEDGRPYFVMEYVRGERLDLHARQLSVKARLHLFCEVCEAVQFAHQNLIVHRDLKPSNIVVTEQGPKLLDFGVAKVLTRDDEPVTVLTRLGASPMTPDYASPEQVQGRDVNTATDIYSLGVVLYEMLVGERPYHLDRHDPQESLRQICEDEPVAPHKLGRDLDRDLGSVVLKALRKKPERRYGSVERMADDIRRYLEGRPVRAHQGAWSYTTGKFVRRHAVGVAMAVVLLAVGLVITVLWRQAEAARDHAEVEQRRAARVTELLVGLFDAPDPNKSKGEALSAREVIERGKERALQGLDEEPEVRAQLLQALGRVYRKLGAYDEARAVLEEALRVRREVLGRRDPLRAESLHDLANILRLQGDWSAAASIATEAVSIQRDNASDHPLELARGLTNLGFFHYQNGAYEAAEAVLEESLAIRRENSERSQLLPTLSNLAATWKMLGRREDAIDVYQEVLAIRQELHGPLHTDVAKSLAALATAHRDLGHLREAETLVRQALEIQEQIEGLDHPQVARTRRTLGTILQAAGRPEAAAAEYEWVLDLQRRVL
ncbi:MAG: serine/threonine-protein kinase, partial [Acidobacteriota bacterium]